MPNLSLDVKDAEARADLADLEDYVEAMTPVSLSVTENGTYTAPTGVFGYSPVNVNVSSSVDYSTTEQDTGRKWIDGKPIYQKTLSVNITFGSGNTNKVTSIPNTTIPNIDTLVDMTWVGDDIGGSRPANPALIDTPMSKWYSKNDGCFQVYISSQYDCILKAITAWYTKTTDTAAE